MARRRGVMSDNLKYEIAKELGIYDTVAQDGDFGNVSSRNCGNMVKKAIEIAERSMLQ
ncbi:MAG: small, acid-soluble spore protein, alpha/beta type [Bacillota bacterium]